MEGSRGELDVRGRSAAILVEGVTAGFWLAGRGSERLRRGKPLMHEPFNWEQNVNTRPGKEDAMYSLAVRCFV